MVIPGECFMVKNFLRIVICTSVEIMEEFGNRVIEFCQAHYKWYVKKNEISLI